MGSCQQRVRMGYRILHDQLSCHIDYFPTKGAAPMTLEELKLRRLAGQHLLAPTDTQTVVKDLCGVQAQFLSHALHGLSIRCTEVNTDGLIKCWTNRGTMHLFSADDLPLFLHEGRTHFLRPVDTLKSDAYIRTNINQSNHLVFSNSFVIRYSFAYVPSLRLMARGCSAAFWKPIF